MSPEPDTAPAPPLDEGDAVLRGGARPARRRWGLWGVLLALVALSLGLASMARSSPSPSSPGEVVSGAVVVYSPDYRVSFFGIERLHPFDIRKYDRIADALVEAGLIEREQFRSPPALPEGALEQVHTAEYLASLREHEHLSRALEVKIPRIFPIWMVEDRVLRPMQRATSGTVEAARAALEHGVGINIGGGYHHARPDLGHGFCVYGDVPLAIATLRGEGFDGQVLIVDTDAHQGDGNHASFAGDDSVYSFSMHQGDAFPFPKLHGDRDLPLERGTDDAAFLAALERELDALIRELQPALIVHVAGADVLADDPLTELGVTVEGLVQRDRMVMERARAANASLLHLLAGGYGPSAAEAQARSISAMLEALP